jgi:hypothetical protein
MGFKKSFFVVLSYRAVVMLSVIMLNVIMLSVIMLNAIMLNVIMLSVIMLNGMMRFLQARLEAHHGECS